MFCSFRSIRLSSRVASGQIFLALLVLVNASCRTQAVEGPSQNVYSLPRETERTVTARNTASEQKPVAPAAAPKRCFWDDGLPPRRASNAEVVAHIARLADVTDMPAQCTNLCGGGPQCGDAAFWRVVRDGQAAIPYLVASLDDATPTSAKVPYMGGVYTKADVAVAALTEIAPDFHVMKVVGIENPDCPMCAWWAFVRGPQANRKLVKRRVAQWFAQHVAHLVWKNEDFLISGDCADDCEHPAGGHYRVAIE